MKNLLGKKLGMTQLFDEDGVVTPVTVIEAGPCFVSQIKNKDKDGYQAVQLAYDETKEQRLTAGQKGHLKRAELGNMRYLREFRVNGDVSVAEGDALNADVFEVGDFVDVVGVSKGKGFQGGMKRHGFSGAQITHGQSDRARAPGSIGQCATPGRVLKGTRMSGRMGTDRVTVQNLRIMLADAERNLIAVKGSIPGAKGSLIVIKEAVKK